MTSSRSEPGDGRDLAVDGALNLRDLGGLPTPNGTTRFHRVVRGGRRERLTARGWRQLAAHGIGHVIDLRTPAEVSRRDTDPRVDPAAWAGFEIHPMPVEDFGVRAYTAALDHPYLNHPGHYRLLLDHFPDELAAVMRLLSEIARTAGTADGAGVYVHCSAGRDRTGLVSAWLLQLAGVADADIVADYRRSLDWVNEYHRTSNHPVEKHEPPEVFEPWAESRTRALGAFLRAHPADTALPALGLTPEETTALRGLLAPASPA